MPHNRRPLQFPSQSQSSVGSFADNFARAFLSFQGLQAKKDALKAQKEATTLKKRGLDLSIAEKLIGLIDERDPAKQTLLANTYIKALGGDPKSDNSKEMKAFFAKANDETRSSLRKALSTVGGKVPPGAIASMVTAMVKGDITLVQAMDQLQKISKKKAVKSFLDAAGPAATQTGGVGGAPVVTQKPLTGGKDFSQQFSRIENAAGRAIDAGNAEAAGSLFDLAAKAKALAKPEPAQSKIGKQVADLTAAVGQYGENSPQTKAIKDVINQTSNPKAKISEVSTIRKQFITASKDFIKSRDAFLKMKVFATNPSPAGDLGILFSYMKILDPGGRVTDQDYALAASRGSFGQRIQSAFLRVSSGLSIEPNLRADFVQAAEKAFRARLGPQKSLENQFRDIAKRSKANPKDVVVDFIGNALSQPKGAGPSPKEIGVMSDTALGILRGRVKDLSEQQFKALQKALKARGLL